MSHGSLRELYYKRQAKLYGTGLTRINRQGALADPEDLIKLGLEKLGLNLPIRISGSPIEGSLIIGSDRRHPSELANLTSTTTNIGFNRDLNRNPTILDEIKDIALREGNIADKRDKFVSEVVTVVKKRGQDWLKNKIKKSIIGRPDLKSVALGSPDALLSSITNDLGLSDPRWKRKSDNELYSDIIREATEGDSSDSPLTTDQLLRYPASPYIKTIHSGTKIRRVTLTDKQLHYSKSNLTTHLGSERVKDHTLEGRRGILNGADPLNQLAPLPIVESPDGRSGNDRIVDDIKWNGWKLDSLDLVPFKIKDKINNKSLYFRCTVKGFSETHAADWSPSRYIGRPFNYYTYNGLDRTATFSFTLYALNAIELKYMWERFNYLVGLTYPAQLGDRNNKEGTGFMIPPFIEITLGGIYKNNPAIITNITSNIPDETTWEIGGETRVKNSSDLKFKNYDRRIKNEKANNKASSDFDKRATLKTDEIEPKDPPALGKTRLGKSKIGTPPPLPGANTDIGIKSTNDIDTPSFGKRFGTFPGNNLDNYDRSDSGLVSYESDDYKLPKIIEANISLVILQDGLPIINSKHFGFEPLHQ